jgi:hypothetical protein
VSVRREPVVRVLGDPVMVVATLPQRVHVHGDATEVRHIMEEPVADLLRDRVGRGDGQFGGHADAQLGMQAVPDPADPDVRDLAHFGRVPGRVPDCSHGLFVVAVEDAHQYGGARLGGEARRSRR